MRARIQVASLNSRLEDKKRRLEAISFRRDAIRAEYQVGYSPNKQYRTMPILLLLLLLLYCKLMIAG